ncbi:diheme cytochrome SoxA (sulfur oxidation) [Hydrogenivirga caldilitoris]|uniref:SoxAX cytochrome complex subunit A n=1 Tax=Hydrogenivirga caldilitoris TaxID=246264 RepID=A0A497XT17_9AQUI|nr:sulfur oxidation c-type cytochrome SoxA [Hydrogenivirga caldilitoris]RLJ71444.1 diheme cytochrome SoxA (sulfur oxidation) [Hydrogenivirga caldilitoris]
MKRKAILASALVAGGAVFTMAMAQEEQLPTHLKELLELGMHPGHAFIDEGKDYYHSIKGANGKTCASCHGQDGEKLQGAYAKMPRYYKDLDRVADIDTRIKGCMTKYMGFDAKDKKFKKDFDKKWRVPLATYVASLSNGQAISVQLDDPQEKEMYKYGEQLWYMRVGARDFSCGICHTVLAGKRIRLQGLPDPVKNKLYTHWPAYRFGSDRMWTMEDRVRSCFKAYFLYTKQWDEKKDWVKKPPAHSDWVIALELYMKHAANGATIEVPGLLR